MMRRLNLASDTLKGAEGLQDARLSDFWQWAFSDLCDDDLKGIFAEWLVHKLLRVQSARRIGWANSDLLTQEGIGIEVKATSYWQSWKLIDGAGLPHPEPLYSVPPDDSKIRFGGLVTRDSTGVADMSTPRAMKSQLYVFAFQHEKDIARWDAMDLSQWEFFVLRAEDLAQVGGRTVLLTKLRPKFGPLNVSQFVDRASRLIQQLVAERDAP